MSRKVSIFPSKQALLEQTLSLILDGAKTAIAQRGRFTIALAGGNTPKPLYEKLAQTPQDWSKWHVFWGDERLVPSDHPDSNERMAREAWLNHVPIPPENIHPLETSGPNPEAAARLNQTALQEFWQMGSDQWPSFDFILLGMGDDGHTASLFPGTDALQVCDRWVAVGNKGDNQRLTLTIPVLNQAKSIALLISGANKSPVLQDIFLKPARDERYPVELIQPQEMLYWMLDQDAGAGISND